MVLPAVGVTSLIATGSPCMGPRAAPDAAAFSAARARARASSANTKQKQLSFGFSSSMRARQFSMSSTGDRDCSRMSRTSSTAGAQARSRSAIASPPLPICHALRAESHRRSSTEAENRASARSSAWRSRAVGCVPSK